MAIQSNASDALTLLRLLWRPCQGRRFSFRSGWVYHRHLLKCVLWAFWAFYFQELSVFIDFRNIWRFNTIGAMSEHHPVEKLIVVKCWGLAIVSIPFFLGRGTDGSSNVRRCLLRWNQANFTCDTRFVNLLKCHRIDWEIHIMKKTENCYKSRYRERL